MRTKEEVSDAKLRGRFYSPDVLVDLSLSRATAMLGNRSGLRVLEPSAGDGAFIRGLGRSRLRGSVEHVEAIEIVGAEAAKTEQALREQEIPGRSSAENFLTWSEGAAPEFDLVLANPPYVRFQFIDDADKERAKAIGASLGASSTAVSNLWIPVFLASLSKLRAGGAFSVILPAEFLTGVSASTVRSWLLSNTKDLKIDLFQPGAFPSVLQEVLVLSGRIGRSASPEAQVVSFEDHNNGTHTWEHQIDPQAATWTKYLLSPRQTEALAIADDLAEFTQLGNVAKFSVSTVTGANAYFCANSEIIDEYSLWDWAIPLLARARLAPGLTLSAEDQLALQNSQHPAWMVSFAADRPDPEEHEGATRFLAKGVASGIDGRYKCRTRSPWYRVPVVPAGELLLSKRSHHYPRLIANHAGAVTTDTIYRGKMNPWSDVSPDDLVATFHNSLTLLSAEVEGRSFGGGVLELVPREVSSLRVPVVTGASSHLEAFSSLSENSKDPWALVSKTDELLVNSIPALTPELLEALGEARVSLHSRRLQRTLKNFY